MKNTLLVPAVLLLVGVYAAAQADDKDSGNDNSSTTLAPTNEICKKCDCDNGAVNCSSREINTFFTKLDWEGLKDFKPLHVDLSGNPLRAVTSLVELPIETLNLSRCDIVTIEKASFQHLQKMKTLDLSHNKLTVDKLNPHVFERMTVVEVHYALYRPLYQISHIYCNASVTPLESRVSMVAGDQLISGVSQGRYSPEEFEPLRSMRTLILAYNDLHSLNDDVFEHLPELTELDLSGNPLKFIDHITLIAIASLPMLKVLKLRDCELSEIPSMFLHSPRYLEYLDISSNRLSAVPLELEEATNLVYLNINNNTIVKLEADSEDNPGFPVLPKLEELHMCNMPKLVEVGEGTLGGLQGLKRLHMGFNRALKTIHPKAMAAVDENGEMYDWPHLTEDDSRGKVFRTVKRIPFQLYLQWNNLSEIDSRLVSQWDHLKVIEVGDNPYLCDCSTQWMVDVLVPIVDALKSNSSIHMMWYPTLTVTSIASYAR
ncbi:TLR4 interactor with leucine rich repeats [Eumeta japonica]|uniref:TLR4 interactor with leucine rich repeats n=1 Tax=Eumeta variegata TaxID=151549 RepID=A0A4C1WBL3_EUMVA|nr:TLR4 interactor with leucine rich repeats [Eumeta japonica]